MGKGSSSLGKGSSSPTHCLIIVLGYDKAILMSQRDIIIIIMLSIWAIPFFISIHPHWAIEEHNDNISSREDILVFPDPWHFIGISYALCSSRAYPEGGRTATNCYLRRGGYLYTPVYSGRYLELYYFWRGHSMVH